MIPKALRRPVLSGIVFANNKAKRLAIHMTKWTGKSRELVHPKHLLGDTDDNYWYLSYLRADATVLDVGCGHGMHALKAAGRCRWVVGVDGDQTSLGIALRTSRAVPVPNTGFLAAQLEDGLPVRSGYFDIVICLDLLEHVHHRDLVLGEIRRALKPGGTLLLAVPNRATSWKRRLERAGLFAYSDPDHKIEYTLQELEQELERNRFRVVRLHPNVYDTPLVGLIDLAGSISLTVYRRLTGTRRRLARKYPEENAGFFAVCAVE
jgi:2-polyprenyl-3-methyl-5-hydroxy-6-metoxy-1,4-benzoquinol methylase